MAFKSIVIGALAALISSTSANYFPGKNPGILMKVDNHQIPAIRSLFEDYLPQWIRFKELPDYYIYTLFQSLPEFMQFRIQWTDIMYDHLVLNAKGVNFYTEVMSEDDNYPVVVMDFPLLNKWDISANQILEFMGVTSEDEVTLHIEDLDIDFKAGLRLDENGYLDPVVYNVKISLGESTITNSNWFLEAIFHGFVKFSCVMIENSSWFWGDYMFTNMLGPVLDKIANHYQMPVVFKSLIEGTANQHMFFVDYRNTRDPEIMDNHIIFSLYGEIYSQSNKRCEHFDPKPVQLMDKPNSQVVFSETAANCIAEQLSHTELGKYTLNKHNYNSFFHTQG